MKKYIILALAALTLSCSACSSSADKKEIEQMKQEIAELKQQVNSLSNENETQATPEATPTQSQSDTSNIDVPEDSIYTAGYYTVGTDIPEGKYDLKWISGNGLITVHDTKDNMPVCENMGDDPDDIREFKNMALSQGFTIKITGNLQVEFAKK